MVQWLELHAPNAGGLGSISGQRTRFHMPQLRPDAAKKKKKSVNVMWYPRWVLEQIKDIR